MISALLGIGLAALLIWGYEDKPEKTYHHNQGHVFGTYYNIRYESEKDLEDSIKAAFSAFDNSLSMFNPRSVLSAVNANRDTVTDDCFEQMWAEAKRVHSLSNGAFDITVAPLVNYWGFGTKEKNYALSLTPKEEEKAAIDSILQFVGFDKIMLTGHQVTKSDPRVMIDAGAVAKGQACDLIAGMLRRNGCVNRLVDIGGEVVCHGVNAQGKTWQVGITKPNLNNEGAQKELQEVVEAPNICMATSGNYNNYYYAGKERRSHTIDPRTGYPVQHPLLSATVISSSCMRADALATACMVLGADSAIQMMAKAKDAECYLIVAHNDSLVTMCSPGWNSRIRTKTAD